MPVLSERVLLEAPNGQKSTTPLNQFAKPCTCNLLGLETGFIGRQKNRARSASSSLD